MAMVWAKVEEGHCFRGILMDFHGQVLIKQLIVGAIDFGVTVCISMT